MAERTSAQKLVDREKKLREQLAQIDTRKQIAALKEKLKKK